MSFEPPKSWDKATLKQILTLRAGGAFSRDLQGRTSGDIPFIKVSDMATRENERFITVAANWVDQADATTLKTKPMPARSVVFAKIGEGMKANRLRILSRPTYLDNNMMAAIPDPDVVDHDFLYYLLIETKMFRYAGGSAMPFLRQGDLYQIEVDLPDLTEQRRIAGVLMALDAKVAANDRIAGKLQSVGELEVARLGRLTIDKAQPLSDLAALLRRGISPQYTDAEDGLLVLNQRCIRDGRVSFVPARRHNEQAKPVGDREVFVGDTLVNSTGVGTLGRTAIVRRTPERSVVDSHVTVVRGDTQKVVPEYLAYAVRDREAEIEALGEGSTGQTELSRKRLGELLVGLPSLSDQEAFARIVRPIDRMIASLEEQTLRLEAIRDSLQPKLVTGNLRVANGYAQHALEVVSR